jgi:two-component system, LuxR family, response regulator FixJ
MVERTVFVVDDDEGARKSVCALVESMGLRAEAFVSGEDFLDHYCQDQPGCLVTDLRMPDISGLELQEELTKRGVSLPVIVLTAYARTAITVRALKIGAVSVLDKPYMDDDLWDAIRMALARDADNRERSRTQEVVRSRLGSLTAQEKDVLDLIVQGQPNKVIAKKLDISVRTVANRRADILAKTGATSTANLIRLAVMGVMPEKPP